ncbi:MAG: pseudouridine synthase [Gammaproteobacteria bacterium]
MHKLLASSGHGSRRKIEEMIREGRITVDGKKASIGQQVTGHETIRIDKRPVSVKSENPVQQHLVYHKPLGEISTRNDPEGRASVFKNLPALQQGRWVSVGRLDINSSGLMLFTTDGSLANKLMHPSSAIDREYAVRILGDVDGNVLEQLLAGVELDDGTARFTDIQRGSGKGANQWYYVVIQEGRNREVRRLWQSQNMTVSRLMRVRYGPIILEKSLRPGRWKSLESSEITALYRAAGLTAPKQASFSGQEKATRQQSLRKKRQRR